MNTRTSAVLLILALALGTAETAYADDGLLEGHAKQHRLLAKRQRTLSGLWTFVSLNYLYADVIGLMDAPIHKQYEEGEVDGVRVTEGFLTGAIIFMQVPLSMIVLSTALSPKHSRIANVAAGTLMTGVQAATLFVGKPRGYYLAASIIEMATTSFIAGYAWKTLKVPAVRPMARASDESFVLGLSYQF